MRHLEKTLVWKDGCALKFTATLLTTAATWKRPKSSSTGEWMKQTRCVYAAGCCSAIRKKETMPFAATWMSLAIFVLSKVDHSSYTWRTCIYLKSVELSIHTNYLALSLFYMFIHFCSLAQSCPALCDPMNRSTPGFPAHHQLPSSLKLMSIQSVIPSNHLILCCPLLALNLSQHQGLFKWVSSSHQVAKVLEFQLQHQFFQWTPRTDLL